MTQNRALELAERRAGLETELVVQHPPRLLVRLERLGLAAAAVEREDQLAAQPLAQRVLRDEHEQLGHELAVAAAVEIGLEPVLERRQPQLLERGRLRARERRVHVGERLAAPQRVRLAQQPRAHGGIRVRARCGEELAERVEIELARLDPDRVPVTGRLDPVAEQPSQPVDLRLERREPAGRQLFPYPLEQPLRRHGPVRVKKQICEESALSRASEPHLPAIRDDLDRTEDPELHARLRPRR